jgi:hypothetical protein
MSNLCSVCGEPLVGGDLVSSLHCQWCEVAKILPEQWKRQPKPKRIVQRLLCSFTEAS